jgi:SAM-dependent methyltransferase
MPDKPGPCPICDAATELTYRGHPGYMREQRYDIWRCEGCGVSFAWPLQSDSRVYDLIYRSPASVPGYQLYARLARKVLLDEDPLGLLARHHPTYWAIREHLTAARASPPGRVLDYGCGLGYFTFALNRAGFDCTGVDISADAIEKARARYGDRYLRLEELSRVASDRHFDTVVCLELIEHVEDPVAFLTAVRQLVASGGEVILSTPDRSAYPETALWATDAPPVHLWWFSRRSLEAMARRSGFASCTFLDLDTYPYGDFSVSPHRDYSRPITVPVFDGEGHVAVPLARRLVDWCANVARKTGVLHYLLWAKEGFRGSLRSPGGASRQAVAVLRG